MVKQIPVPKLYKQKMIIEELEKVKMMKEHNETLFMAAKNIVTAMQLYHQDNGKSGVTKDKDNKGENSNAKCGDGSNPKAKAKKDAEHRIGEILTQINCNEDVMKICMKQVKEFYDKLNQFGQLFEERNQKVAEDEANKEQF